MKESKKIRISCIGDSITYGHLSSDPATKSWPARLGELLGDGYAVSNFGVNASLMVDNVRYPVKYQSVHARSYIQTQRYADSLLSEPDIVTIALGANDAGMIEVNEGADAYYEKAAHEMIATYRALPSHPKVILVIPTSRESESRRAIEVEKVNPILRRVAAEEGCPIVDLFPLFDGFVKAKNTKPVLVDGLHPNDIGYRLIAEMMLPAILGV